MANVHRLGDYNNNQNNNYRPGINSSDSRVNSAFQNQPLLGGGLTNQ